LNTSPLDEVLVASRMMSVASKMMSAASRMTRTESSTMRSAWTTTGMLVAERNSAERSVVFRTTFTASARTSEASERMSRLSDRMCAKASDTDVTAVIDVTAGTAVTDITAGTDMAAGTAVIDGTVVMTVRTMAGTAPSGLTTASVIMMTDVKEASAEVIMVDTTTTVATMFTAMTTRAFSSIFSQGLSLYAAPTPIIL